VQPCDVVVCSAAPSCSFSTRRLISAGACLRLLRQLLPSTCSSTWSVLCLQSPYLLWLRMNAGIKSGRSALASSASKKEGKARISFIGIRSTSSRSSATASLPKLHVDSPNVKRQQQHSALFSQSFTFRHRRLRLHRLVPPLPPLTHYIFSRTFSINRINNCAFSSHHFSGKVLLERLLSASTGSGRIYVLLRPSRKQPDIKQRLATILSGPVFSLARERGHNFSERFVAIAGDVSQERLGMHEDERDLVCSCCSVVVHCAATVKFHEHLLDAIQVVCILLPPLVLYRHLHPPHPRWFR
jgi:hypothetical protein